MSFPRFYCARLAPGGLELDEAESRHALQTLRLRPGDELELFDGRGASARAVLIETDALAAHRGGKKARKAAALVRVSEVREVQPRGRRLTLITAACKGDRLDWLVEKGTELGVARFIFAEFERSVVHSSAEQGVRLSRTALEACKQSRNLWLPEITAGVSLTQALATAPSPLVVAHLSHGAAMLGDYLAQANGGISQLTAVIGPEGGLTDAEVALLRQRGATVIRLAPTILRVETAALAVAANWAARA